MLMLVRVVQVERALMMSSSLVEVSWLRGGRCKAVKVMTCRQFVRLVLLLAGLVVVEFVSLMLLLSCGCLGC